MAIDSSQYAMCRRAFAALLLGLIAACAHAGEEAPPPRFDGLYVSDETSGYRSYIRFYPDGAVVMASVADPSTPQQVARWLSPSHPWSAAGSYELRGPRIFLSVTGRSPTVDASQVNSVANSYQGLIRGQAILLDREGADVSVTTYRFAPAALEN